MNKVEWGSLVPGWVTLKDDHKLEKISLSQSTCILQRFTDSIPGEKPKTGTVSRKIKYTE